MSKWISTKDLMPPLHEEVLLYMPEIDAQLMESPYAIGYIESDGNFYFNNYHENIESVEYKYITHWIWLPEHPNE